MNADTGPPTDLVNHVTFRVPALVAHVPFDFYELFQNGGLATCTLGGEARRVVVMTIYIVVFLII